MKGGSEPRKQLRLFLDSNVLTGGIVARWGLDRAVLSLCAAKICRLVLAEAVREEVAENLLLHAPRLDAPEAQQLLDDYTRLIELAQPEVVPYPGRPKRLFHRGVRRRGRQGDLARAARRCADLEHSDDSRDRGAATAHR
ncbi:MAG: hypothetical protein DMG09_19345 [Acidobacteria bacterium]|nr:MAG: hypothetical protein DMG09_19345 [Acidobacteriota bacterium]